MLKLWSVILLIKFLCVKFLGSVATYLPMMHVGHMVLFVLKNYNAIFSCIQEMDLQIFNKIKMGTFIDGKKIVTIDWL